MPVTSDPTKLSSQGLYSDIAARKVVPEALEYRPDYALWSDGADKHRWIILPQGEEIDTSDLAHWVFPVGTKFFKEFSQAGKLLETRLIERVKQTGFIKNDYFMGTYIWRADQSDAILAKDGRDNVLGTEHDVPQQKACIVCHQGEPGAVLGFSAVQLSASGMLRKIVKKKWLSEDPERMPEWPGDDVQKAALGVMHANCGHCHAEKAMADFMHLRFLPGEVGLPFEELDAYETTVGVKLSDEWEHHPERFELRVVPGDPDASAIAYRMGTRGDDELVADQMPPLATRKVDDDGLSAVRRWIESLAEVVIPDAGVEKPDASVVDSGEGDAGGADAAVGDAGEVDAGGASGGPATGGSGAASPAADGGAPARGQGAAGARGSQGTPGAEPPVAPNTGAAVGGGAAGVGGEVAGAGGEVAGSGGEVAGSGGEVAGAGGEVAGAGGGVAGGGSGVSGASGEVVGSGGASAAGSGAVAGGEAGDGVAGSAGRDAEPGETAGPSAPGGAGSGGDPSAGSDASGGVGSGGIGTDGAGGAAGSTPSGGDGDVRTDEAADHDARSDEAADHDAHADEGAHGHG